MPEWMTRDDALAELNVRPQTLYAYVSRKLIERRPDPADGSGPEPRNPGSTEGLLVRR